MSIISIIIPVYNVEDYIDECLDSVVNQTYNNIQIILVDDGSVDNSGKICDYWARKDHRISVIHKQNGGLSSARNVGIQHASGSFVAFLDSDDILNREFCAKMYAAINNEPTCDVVACGITKFNDPDVSDSFTFFSYYNKIVNVREFWKLILRHESDNAVWGKLFRKDIIKNSKFRQGILNEDLIFYLDITPNLHTIKYVDESLYYYRIRSGSITNRVSPRISDFFRNALEMKNTIGANPEWRLEKEANGFVLTEITNVLATIEKFDDRQSQEVLCREMLDFVMSEPIKSFRNKYWSVPKKLKFILVCKFPSLYRFLLKFK